MKTEDKNHWSLVIEPSRTWFDLRLHELWPYRDLVRLFVRRDFVAIYKQTLLGPLWYLIQPILSTVVFTIVFGRIAAIPTQGIPPFLFYMAGTVAWGYFADCLTSTSQTFIGNAALFGKVYFPRLTVPLALVLSNFIKFSIQLLLFVGFLIFFWLKGAPIESNLGLFLLPLIILQAAMLGMGCGILISALTTKYRDLSFLVNFGVQLWMYATPIVYPLAQIPERYRLFYLFNPMTAPIEYFRHAFLGVPGIGIRYIAASWILTGILLLLGLVQFCRIERTFMDTV